MDVLIDRIKREAERVHDSKGKLQFGTVAAYDPNNYAVVVTLQPDGYVTGWIPLGSILVGNGWGVFCPPSIGDQVEVDFQESSRQTPVANLRLFDNNNRPLAVQSGEIWLVHKSGAYLKLTNDGKASINAATEIDIGNLGTSLHMLVTDAFMALFNDHTHTSGNDGGATGVPIQQMTSSQLTRVLKAN